MFQQPDETQERAQLRASVADFVKGQLPAGRGTTGAAGGTDPKRWREMAGLGWLGLQLPEDRGGIGLAAGDLVALHQEVGRGALAEPLIPVALLAARLVALGDNAALRQALLPGLLGGETPGTLAWQARAGTASADDIGPTATPAQQGWVVEGSAVFVPIAAEAAGLVVAALGPAGPLLFWVRQQPRVQVAQAPLADGNGAATVRFDGVRVEQADLIAGPQRAAALLAEALDTASLAASGELLGAMEQMLQMTVDYMNQRVQFGKPIGSYQALQHRAVDVFVQVELARSVLQHAVAVFEGAADARQRATVASQAKSRCSDAGMHAVKHCIQMHGAIAYTEEYALSRYIRRVVTLAASHGTAAAHRRRYARLTNLGKLEA